MNASAQPLIRLCPALGELGDVLAPPLQSLLAVGEHRGEDFL